MKRVYLVPNIITAFSLACGLFIIFKINMIEPGAGDYEVVQMAAFILLVAVIADFMDGALARAIHAETEFGFVFDSLSDAISFGVAPSVLMLKSLSFESGSFLSFFSATGAMVYSLCGVLRLVRFSVRAQEVKKKSLELQAAQKKHFTGLPIPAAAIAAVSLNFVSLSPFLQLSNTDRVIVLPCVMILLGYLMVCRLKFPSLKMLHFKIPSFHLAFLMVVAAVFILYGILYFSSLILALVAWAYVAVSLVLSLIRRFWGKGSKTLAEFDPDAEEEEEEP